MAGVVIMAPGVDDDSTAVVEVHANDVVVDVRMDTSLSSAERKRPQKLNIDDGPGERALGEVSPVDSRNGVDAAGEHDGRGLGGVPQRFSGNPRNLPPTGLARAASDFVVRNPVMRNEQMQMSRLFTLSSSGTSATVLQTSHAKSDCEDVDVREPTASTPGNKENRMLVRRLLRSARFVPLIALKHAAEAHSVNPTAGEREVEAVVVLADVSGYTTLAEACNRGAGGAGAHANLVGSPSAGLAGAERMRDALNEYLGNMIDMMTEHGADIVKFAGDAVMALWEVKKMGLSSNAAAETALRATAVCLKMNAAMDNYTCRDLPKGSTLRLHTVVGYGTLSVMFVGGVDQHWLQLPVGDPITQVAPILDAAQPGTLVVSKETHELLKDAFECKPVRMMAEAEDGGNAAEVTKEDNGDMDGDGGQSRGEWSAGDAAEEKVEVIGMEVISRTEKFPDRLAQDIDARCDELQSNMRKRAMRRVINQARRSSVVNGDQSPMNDHLFDSLEDSPVHPNGTVPHSASLGPRGSGGSCSGSVDFADSPITPHLQSGGQESPTENSPLGDGTGRSVTISGDRAYRKRVEDIFKTACVLTRQASNFLTRQNGIFAARTSFAELKTGSLAISPEHYDAVLSFIPPPSRVALTESIAELRRVTVMFITLESPALLFNSSRSSSATRPSHSGKGRRSRNEQLQHLHQIAITMQREVVRHDGFVKELTMDDKGLVMVVGFGVPPCCRWAQDPVLGACEAALGIKSSLKQYGHRCGIGITTGEVFCGTIGNSKRSEYSMIGSVVNLAARLMGAAAKLQKGIFVDCNTQQVAVRDGLMNCKFFDDIKVKGKLEAVPVWRLKSASRKRFSTVSVGSDESALQQSINTLSGVAMLPNENEQDDSYRFVPAARRHSTLSFESLDDLHGMSKEKFEIVGRENELGIIREVMAAAAEAGAHAKNQGKRKDRSRSDGGGNSSGMLSALFRACLGGGEEKRGQGKCGKLVLIEGESGIGKTCLLNEVERSMCEESGYFCFSANFSTYQEVNYGWWYILRQMYIALGDQHRKLLTHSQMSRLTMLLEVGDMMLKTERDMRSMGQKGIAIQRELIHALLMLMDTMTSAGVPGIMLVLDDATHLDTMGMDTVHRLLQPLPGYYPYTKTPFFPAVPNLVVIMALRPVPHASPTFKTHYAVLRELADEHIKLSGLSCTQLRDRLLKSKLLTSQWVEEIEDSALRFLYERSNGNFTQAMAWLTELLDTDYVAEEHLVDDASQLSRQSGRGSDLCYHDEQDADADRMKNLLHVPPPPTCLYVCDAGAAERADVVRRLMSHRRSLDGFPLGKIASGRLYVPEALGKGTATVKSIREDELLGGMDDYDGEGEGGEAEVNTLKLHMVKAMQACVRIPRDACHMYTVMNDSLSPPELLALRVCSVLGEITPETLIYVQPGGWAEYLQQQQASEFADTPAQSDLWRGEMNVDMEESYFHGEIPDLKKTLNKLVERGFLVQRTRGSVQTCGSDRLPGLVTRDSLDGTAAVLSHHVTQIYDTHTLLDGNRVDEFLFGPISEGDEPEDDTVGESEPFPESPSRRRSAKQEDEEDATKLLIFASFVHQEVTYQGWGLEQRRKVHQRMSDVATEIMMDLYQRRTELLNCLKPQAEASNLKLFRQKVFRYNRSERTLKKMRKNIDVLLTSTHMLRIHHTMMSGEFAEAKAAWMAAQQDLGGFAELRSMCQQKVLNVFNNIPGHFDTLESKNIKEWTDLHFVLLPWIRGVAQMFQLEARRRWGLIRAIVPWLRLFHQLRSKRISVAARSSLY